MKSGLLIVLAFLIYLKRMKDYAHVHKQNIEYCPATYKMVEKMIENR